MAGIGSYWACHFPVAADYGLLVLDTVSAHLQSLLLRWIIEEGFLKFLERKDSRSRLLDGPLYIKIGVREKYICV